MNDNANLDDVFGLLRRTEASLREVTPAHIRQQYDKMHQLIANAIAELETPKKRPDSRSPQQA